MQKPIRPTRFEKINPLFNLSAGMSLEEINRRVKELNISDAEIRVKYSGGSCSVNCVKVERESEENFAQRVAQFERDLEAYEKEKKEKEIEHNYALEADRASTANRLKELKLEGKVFGRDNFLKVRISNVNYETLNVSCQVLANVNFRRIAGESFTWKYLHAKVWEADATYRKGGAQYLMYIDLIGDGDVSFDIDS